MSYDIPTKNDPTHTWYFTIEGAACSCGVLRSLFGADRLCPDWLARHKVDEETTGREVWTELGRMEVAHPDDYFDDAEMQ